MNKFKKILSLVLACVMFVSCLSVNVFAEDLNDYDKTQLIPYTFTSKTHTQNLTVNSDSVLTFYLTTPTYDSGNYKYNTSCTLQVKNSSGTILFDEYCYDNTNTTLCYQLFLPKGGYTLTTQLGSFIESYVYTYNYKTSIDATTNYGKGNKVQSGKSISYRYLQQDNISYLTLTSNSRVSLYCTVPQNLDGDKYSVDIIVRNSKGTVIFEDFLYLGDSKYSGNVYLKKGSYTINYKLSSDYGYYNKITNTYKNTVTPLSKLTLKKPTLKYKKTSYGNGYYRLNFSWSDNSLYDGIQVYTKTNTGSWKLKQTITNSTYWRYTGFTTTYRIGDASYYKIRAYKECEGFKWYSDYSNAVSVKKLAKPTVKVSAGKKYANIKITKKVYGATGYEVYRSTKKSSGFKKIKTIKSTSYKNKGLKSKKNYYYKVRTYKVVGGSKVYSSFSSVKKVKIK